jgi:DNA-binding transcriptional regulator YdaS (Cro superfamily)
MDSLSRAIAAAGSQQTLARALGITQQALSQWKQRRVPAERVLDIERITGVPRHDLRPDIYPAEAAQ